MGDFSLGARVLDGRQSVAGAGTSNHASVVGLTGGSTVGSLAGPRPGVTRDPGLRPVVQHERPGDRPLRPRHPHSPWSAASGNSGGIWQRARLDMQADRNAGVPDSWSAKTPPIGDSRPQPGPPLEGRTPYGDCAMPTPIRIERRNFSRPRKTAGSPLRRSVYTGPTIRAGRFGSSSVLKVGRPRGIGELDHCPAGILAGMGAWA